MRRWTRRAFTIIELLIALSIFAVAAITLYSVFFAGVSVWKRSGEGSDAYQEARIAFDDAAANIRNMIYFTKDKESMYAFSGAPQKIVFMTSEETATEKMEPLRKVARVAYSFDEAKGTLCKQAADITLGFDIQKAPEETLLDGLEDFKFEYCYDSGDEDEPYSWQEEWKDQDMRTPRGVRMTAELKNPGGAKKTAKLSRTIFIPTGILGKKEP